MEHKTNLMKKIVQRVAVFFFNVNFTDNMAIEP